MSSSAVGIDLGTTYSVVAVPEATPIPDKERLIAEKRLLPVNGVLVICNELKQAVIPSAVWVGPDGKVLVGQRAKQKAGNPNEPPPAMFFKRLMGTADVVRAGHRDLSPEQASAYVLGYLKEMAEQVLGDSVDQAVITVPAFFELPANQATHKAGMMAGFVNVDTLLEPVAAALMYLRGEANSGGNLMVYDLGGGTFDVSISVPDPATGFRVAAFEGDRFLGGYDFDRAIVNWLIEQYRDAYSLDLDLERRPDAALFQHLLTFAEKAKIGLSTEDEVTITVTNIQDLVGEPMQIDGQQLSRLTFAELIDERFGQTILACGRALSKAGLSPEQISQIIMVGGSSNIPMVGEELLRHYGKQPRLVNPNLCVAIGAAIKAATMVTRSGCLVLDHVPTATSEDQIDVGGEVVRTDAVGNVANLVITLRTDNGTFAQRQATNADGQFLFQDVPIQLDAVTTFIVAVDAGEGSEEVTFSVRNPGGVDPPPPPVLPHDVTVKVASGFSLVAPAGSPLPYTNPVPVPLRTVVELARIPLGIYDGNTPIGEVVVETDRPVPVGTEVQLSMVFHSDWTIEAFATVPAANAGAAATLYLPREETPDWGQLTLLQAQNEATYADKRAFVTPAALLTRGPAIEAGLAETRKLLVEQQDRQHCHSRIKQTRMLIDRLTVEEPMKPSMLEFDERLDEVDDLLERLAKSPKKAEYPAHKQKRDTLAAAGKAAYEAKNQATWTLSNDQLKSLGQDIRRQLQGDEKPTALQVAALCAGEAEELRSKAAAHGQCAAQDVAECDAIKQDAEAVFHEALKLPPTDHHGESVLYQKALHLYQAGLIPLKEHLEPGRPPQPGPDGPVVDKA